MSIMVRDSGKEFTPAPEGMWPAVCCDVVLLENYETAWGRRDVVRLFWEIDQIDEEQEGPNGEAVPFRVMKQYTASLNKRANLRKDLESWRGRAFAGEELAGFDLEKLIGVNGQVLVAHNVTDNGRTYANVQAITKARKDQPKLRVSDTYVRVRDREKQSVGGDGAVAPGECHESAADDDIPF